MRHSLARTTFVLLLTFQVFVPTITFSQKDPGRPRTVSPPPPAKPDTKNSVGEWKPTGPQTTFDERIANERIDDSTSRAEPTIRVALATDVRSATISTSGHLLNGNEEATSFVPLEVARVRLEPHLLSPLPPIESADNVQIQIAGMSAKEDAQQKAKDVRDAIGEDSQIVYDAETTTWRLLIGAKRSAVEAEELRARLESAGLDATVESASRPDSVSRPDMRVGQTTQSPARFPVVQGNTNVKPQTAGTVRAAARFSLPTREVVASAPGAGRLFSSSAPVTFASDSETSPVRYDERPYRGRIEVFTNTRGALTVVNVLGLEDYVKGVVPNELSAGGFPALEAHKAQAIAARTYALRNRGQFMSQGYDLLPTTRSQVYRGLSSENALSTRAVDETRGMIATYNGEPINALYTSTCGGRTEDAENIFNNAVPYLKGRECAAEGRAALANFIVRTRRDPVELKEAQNVPLARDVALLVIQNFASLRDKVSDSWLKGDAEVSEVRSWLASVARLARQPAPAVTEEVNKPPAFATALSVAAFGESRGSTLLNSADVEYFLAMRDAGEVPPANRADVAMLIRDGYLAVLPDGSLNPREPLSRGRALHSISRLLEARGLLQLQRASARPTADDNLILRSTKGKDQLIKVSDDAFLFRQIGELIFPVRSVALVGGEPVVFHVNAAGEVDYLEVRPAANGAAADRFSPFTNWTTELSLGQAQARLGRFARGIGSLVDLRVVSRGHSRRVTDLEVVGSDGTRQVLGGRIRSALGLREQLFVIERKYDESGRVIGFAFLGRGWGHGVGMCQVGAYGLAKQGFTYEQILKAYYTGIELTRMY
ncbi:MAG TPA: SpoIID/LytB domain-containing protein [Pyrinomonadaceae bacterium]|jgi:stage II sporulation protein D